MIIAGGQINNALGLRNLHRHESFVMNVWESLRHVGDTNWHALVWFLFNFVANFTLSVRWVRPLFSLRHS